jgi:hypothetical protein
MENYKETDVILTKVIVTKHDEEGNSYINQYKIEKTYGKGAYSKVKSVSTENGEKWAMKQFFKPSLKKTMTSVYDANNHIAMSNALVTVYHEIENMSWIQNPNIVKLREIIDDP